MTDYLICHGADLHACKVCQRYFAPGAPIAAVFSHHPPITPSVQGVRCFDFRTAPSTAPTRGHR